MLIHFLFDWAIPDILYIILHVQHRYRISGWSTKDTYWCCNPFQSIWNGIRICQGQRWRLRVLSNQEDTDTKPHCASHNSDPSNQCRKCMWRLGKCPGHCMFDPYNPLQRSLVVNNNKISRSSHKNIHIYFDFVSACVNQKVSDEFSLCYVFHEIWWTIASHNWESHIIRLSPIQPIYGMMCKLVTSPLFLYSLLWCKTLKILCNSVSFKRICFKPKFPLFSYLKVFWIRTSIWKRFELRAIFLAKVSGTFLIWLVHLNKV